MKTKEEILKPFVETPFRHTKIVDYDNALKAMDLYHNQKLGYKIRIGKEYYYSRYKDSLPVECIITDIYHDGMNIVYEFNAKGLNFTIYPETFKPNI